MSLIETIEYFIIVTSSFMIFVYSNEISNITEYDESSRFFLFPTGYGKVEVVDKFDLNLRSFWFQPEDDILYLLYTRKNVNTPHHLKIGNGSSLMVSNYNHSNPVKIIVHGWKSGYKSDLNKLLISAYLSTVDANVIVVDWSEGSSSQYVLAAMYVPRVGLEIAKLIDWLVAMNTSVDNFHLLGHSLGAHVVGNAGRNVKSGKIPYITALDPAGPLWNNLSERIRPSDAEYVEVIHTSAGFAGLQDTVGDVDFFPNGGRWMPGCGMNIACSHSRSYEYFTETVSSSTKHFGKMCPNQNEISKSKCMISSRVLSIGGEVRKASRGIFYFKTSDKKPFLD